MGGRVAATHGGAGDTDAGFARVRPVADAILYEGYLLYPYRRSSPKNQVRWQFGILAPRGWVEAAGPVATVLAGSVESWRQQTECVLETTGDPVQATVRLCVRYLQVQAKTVERAAPGGHEPVESLDVDGVTHLSFDEAVPREVDISVPLVDLLDDQRAFAVGAPAGEEFEPLPGGARVARRRRPVPATTTVSAQRLDAPVPAYRLRVVTENAVTDDPQAGPDAPRPEALRRSLVAAHAFLGGRGLRYISLIDPDPWAVPYAKECRNIHTFPVLAGDPEVDGGREVMLSSPILLYDHPRIAPESPGDLHDAAEIDEILSLRTLTLTDEEKAEARATDPRAAAILARVDDMPREVMARLHGAIRSPRPGPSGPSGHTPTEGESDGPDGCRRAPGT